MSINIPTHYVQQYSTNISLLLQQKGSKLRDAVTVGNHVGTSASPVDQIGSIEAQLVTSRFAPMGRVDATTDRRWVSPKDYDLPQLIDSFDKLRLLTDPSSQYVQNAVMAMGRKQDYEILTAVTGTAKTGVTGGTSTSFTAGNEVDVATGGANSKINMAKLRAVKKLMMANHIDFDMEEAYVGLTAADYDALMNEPEVISRDYSSNLVLESGKLKGILGFKFIHCELIETVLAGTNEVTLPVWVKSGMHLGKWQDVQTSVSKRNDLKSEPWQAYCIQTIGATRLEENKVYAIESYRA